MSDAPPPSTPDHRSRPANRLARETSPYLRQHAHNPVDWYPWGEEALERARREDKPILLSVGYSACHWCHVMERESFEDEDTARLMNQSFVNIKVDREERPDIDEIYMTAVQLLTHHGGWPMTVFLTPAGEPYFGGTYFPPDDRHGMPSFRTVLTAMSQAYREQRGEVATNGRQLVAEMRRIGQMREAAGKPDAALLAAAENDLARHFDQRNGGFGWAPKFPSPMSLSFLLRRHRATGNPETLRIVTHSLARMAAGGIHDHLGGGFHRYTVDERWLTPHFEKMLYDNAQLARLYLEAWQVTGDPALRRVAEGVLAYVRRDMTRPGGGFFATEDADSEGEEGKFYVWTPAELSEVLGADTARLFALAYDVTPGGNFEHQASILNRPRRPEEVAAEAGLGPDELEARLGAARERLLAHRGGRVRPHRDEKILVAWNGLMLSAMALGARLLGSAADLAAAVETGEFLWRELRRDGRLLHTYKDGEARIDAFLDDHAALVVGYLDLYQATFDPRWLERAVVLGEALLADFEDPEGGGFYFTSRRAEVLVARSKNPYDNAVPGGNSLAAHLLLRLHALTGEPRFLAAAERTLAAFHGLMQRAPQGAAHLLEALDASVEGFAQVVIAGRPDQEATRALVAAAFRPYAPNRVVALADPGVPAPATLAALVAGKEPVGGQPAAYLCRGFTCERPEADAATLTGRLAAPARPV